MMFWRKGRQEKAFLNFVARRYKLLPVRGNSQVRQELNLELSTPEQRLRLKADPPPSWFPRHGHRERWDAAVSVGMCVCTPVSGCLSISGTEEQSSHHSAELNQRHCAYSSAVNSELIFFGSSTMSILRELDWRWQGGGEWSDLCLECQRVLKLTVLILSQRAGTCFCQFLQLSHFFTFFFE